MITRAFNRQIATSAPSNKIGPYEGWWERFKIIIMDTNFWLLQPPSEGGLLLNHPGARQLKLFHFRHLGPHSITLWQSFSTSWLPKLTFQGTEKTNHDTDFGRRKTTRPRLLLLSYLLSYCSAQHWSSWSVSSFCPSSSGHSFAARLQNKALPYIVTASHCY